MRQLGFSYVAVPQKVASHELAPRLRLADAAAGYPQLRPETPAAVDLQLGSMSVAEQQRYETALVGDPSDTSPITVNGSHMLMPVHGCQSRAEEALYGDRYRWAPLYLLVLNLVGQKQFSTSADSELQTTTSRWESCMGRHNQRFVSPAEAITAAAASDGQTLTTPSASEKQIAIADATCREETGWDDVNEAAQQRALMRVETIFSKQIAEYRQIQVKALARSADLSRPS